MTDFYITSTIYFFLDDVGQPPPAHSPVHLLVLNLLLFPSALSKFLATSEEKDYEFTR